MTTVGDAVQGGRPDDLSQRIQITEADLELPSPATGHPNRPSELPVDVPLDRQPPGFRLEAVAGRGGMGVVYRAVQLSLDRTVAIKLIRADLAAHPDYRRRFLREARLAASVSHPHVVTVYDVQAHDDELFLIMQWVDGRHLGQVIRREGLRIHRAIELVKQLAGAIDAVHAVGLIHHDIKPANVLVTRTRGSDNGYLTDFGVARATEDLGDPRTTMVGTTGFIAPEQIAGNSPDRRSDLYSFGCVVFEMIVGAPPFVCGDETAARHAHANGPRPLASHIRRNLGDRFDGVLLRALAVDPAARFDSARELAEALEAALIVRTSHHPPRASLPAPATTPPGPVDQSTGPTSPGPSTAFSTPATP